MKTIGFVDYYINEWHANNYPKWIIEASKKLGVDYQVKYCWAEEYISKADGLNTDDWCKKFNVTKCETIKELCEKCDHIMILAPSDPEKHLEYAKEVLKYKKHTYIDKTFAPDYNTAKEIFEIGEKYNTKFFTSSALRYATELNGLDEVKNIITTGGGGNAPEYIIHQIEPIVKLLNAKPKRLKVNTQGKQSIFTVDFGDKKATMIYDSVLPFAIYPEFNEGSANIQIQSDFFAELMVDILKFFESGEIPFDPQQTLDVMKIREFAVKGLIETDKWFDLQEA